MIKTKLFERGFRYWEIDPEVRVVSHWGLEKFRESIALYRAIFIDKTIEREPPTEAMALGSALNLVLLERHPERIAVMPDVDGRTKAGKIAKEEFRSSLTDDMVVITAEQQIHLNNMVESACHHKAICKLLEAPGQVEQGIITGVSAKVALMGYLDKLCDDGTILELKTTFDPSPDTFARTAANKGYHRQVATYDFLRSEAMLAGLLPGLEHRPNRQIIHVVIQSQPPYECACYTLDDHAMMTGWRQVNADLEEFGACVESNLFESRMQNGVFSLSLPPWALKS